MRKTLQEVTNALEGAIVVSIEEPFNKSFVIAARVRKERVLSRMLGGYGAEPFLVDRYGTVTVDGVVELVSAVLWSVLESLELVRESYSSSTVEDKVLGQAIIIALQKVSKKALLRMLDDYSEDGEELKKLVRRAMDTAFNGSMIVALDATVSSLIHGELKSVLERIARSSLKEEARSVSLGSLSLGEGASGEERTSEESLKRLEIEWVSSLMDNAVTRVLEDWRERVARGSSEGKVFSAPRGLSLWDALWDDAIRERWTSEESLKIPKAEWMDSLMDSAAT